VASTPTVSVVMPTFNRLPTLRRALRGLAEQEELEQPFEVVVVSDGSTDGTDRFLTSGDVPLPVLALFQENAGPAAARNRGVDAASGDLVLFLDDDVVPTPGLVAAHVRDHPPDDDVVVIGPMNTPPDHDISPWIQWEQNMLAKQYDAMDRGVYGATARQFYTGNASVARRHVIAAGGFDPSFRRAEDVELAYRLADRGLRFEFDHDAVVLHYAARSFSAWRRAAADYGHNDVIFARDHGRAWLLESICGEFAGRNALIRSLTRVCLPRPRLGAATTSALSLVAKAAGRVGADAVAQRTLSAVYNLEYYRGMAAELGDAHDLLARFDLAAAA
jgi:glycosyltransferase involved in cell wall biosynthesis